jgi:hypothetical protein
MSDISLQVSTGLPDEQMHMREYYIHIIHPNKSPESSPPKKRTKRAGGRDNDDFSFEGREG